MVLKLKDGRKELYQWDVGVVVDVTDENINEVHFSNLRYGVSFNIEVQNGTVTIPPEVLQSGADVFCWAFVRQENGGYTKKEQIFNVEKRPRPADYVYTPTEVLTWEALKQQIEKLEKGTIKTVSNVKLWELETGIYYVTGICSKSPAISGDFGDKKHIFIIYKIKTDCVKYLHFCGGIYGTTWKPIECGVSSGVAGEYKEYQLTDTSMMVNIIDKNSPDNKFPSARSVYVFGDDIKKEFRTEIDALKTELQGNINEISALVGGA